jgi:O-antigen/teichoic acid export membrane protein
LTANGCHESVVNEVKTNAIESMKWTFLAEIISKSIPPVIMLILAHLLTPDDFGLVGVAMIAIGFAQVFQDLGLGKTLIQREENIDESANIVFWSSVVSSTTIYIFVFIFAEQLAEFFHDPRLQLLLRVLCIQIILTSLISAHQSLLQRNFEFKRLFLIRLGPSLVPGIISIPLAVLTNLGVWALVLGSLFGSFVQVILFWLMCDWRPAFRFNFKLSKELFGFGMWVLLEMFLSWLIMWGDSIVLGHYLEIGELGVYRVGFSFVTLLFALSFNPLFSIAYPMFSRVHKDISHMIDILTKLTKLVSVISLPLGTCLAITASSFSPLIFGQKWQGIDVVIALIGLEFSIGYLVGLNPHVYRAMGRPHVNSIILIINVFSFIPIFILAAPHGLFIFCLSRFGISIASLGLHLYIANRLLGIPFTYLKDCILSPLFAVIGLAVFLIVAKNLLETMQGIEGFIKLFFLLSGGALLYSIMLKKIDREIYSSFLNLIRVSLK